MEAPAGWSASEEVGVARLGIVTIGQAPRTDMVPRLRPLLGPVEVVEHGALDPLGAADIAALAPEPGEQVLVSRLRDGTSARLAHDRVEPLVHRAVERAESAGADATLLVCTGSFGAVEHRRPLLFAERLLVHGVAALAAGMRVGVVCPDADQEAMTVDKWRPHTGVPLVACADPYRHDPAPAVAASARRLAARGAQLVVLDCMGYAESARTAAVAAGVPVVLARSLVARMAAELVQR